MYWVGECRVGMWLSWGCVGYYEDWVGLCVIICDWFGVGYEGGCWEVLSWCGCVVGRVGCFWEGLLWGWCRVVRYEGWVGMSLIEC